MVWSPSLALTTAAASPARPVPGFQKRASAQAGLAWELQKLLEEEVYNRFLND